MNHRYLNVNPQVSEYVRTVLVLENGPNSKSSTLPLCKPRDRIVFETAKKNSIPIVASMGGGYSEFLDVIDAHANTYLVA